MNQVKGRIILKVEKINVRCPYCIERNNVSKNNSKSYNEKDFYCWHCDRQFNLSDAKHVNKSLWNKKDGTKR